MGRFACLCIPSELSDEATGGRYARRITWVFFDIGSTLVDESIVYENRFKSIAHQSSMDYDCVRERAIELYKQNRKGDLEIIKEFGVAKPAWNTCDEKLYADAVFCLESLSKKYKTGIIANQETGLRERLFHFGILGYFDLIVSSAEEGVLKPDVRIFEIALERSGCRPDQAVMIGDRIDNDILPAKSIGMNTIWIRQGFGGLWNMTAPEEKPDDLVDCLSGILSIL